MLHTTDTSTRSVTIKDEMALTCRKPLDPKNEALRRAGELDGPFDLEPTIIELLEKTPRIHAGFLFDQLGKEALGQLCLCLSATKTSPHYQGWENFGICLGLNQLQIQVIDYRFNKQDPAHYILLAFVHKQDPTLDKIISTLIKMQRDDIIIKVADLFMRLTNDVMRNHLVRSNDDSAYSSISSSQYEEAGDNDYRNMIIWPPSLPPVPLVLQEFSRHTIGIDVATLNSYVHTTDTDAYQNSLNCNITIEKKNDQNDKSTSQSTPHKKLKYVMLTFASDGLLTALNVAQILRQETDRKQRIGVLILHEHSNKVNADPTTFILSCFDQVDYVIPIITKGYLEEVSSSNSKHLESSLPYLDAKYVKYIYTLMKTKFLHDGCINEKVRCIVSEKQLHLTHTHPLMRDPLFQAWVKQSETEELGQRILKSAF